MGSGRPGAKDPWDALRSEHADYPLRAVIGRDDIYNHYIDSTQKALYARALPLEEDFTVLDFGCGNGRWALWFAPQVDRVVGVDLSPEMVRTAQRLASDQGIRNADFVVLDDEAPSLPDNSFDVVNCVWVLKYILSAAEAATTIAELSRATKPGGHVALIEQVTWSRDLLVESEGYFQGQALYRTPGFYINAFEECGMHLRHHAITNASPLFWAYSRLRRAVHRLAGVPPGTGPPRRITAVSVHGDLLAGRVMRFRSGHHFFLFQKQEEPVNHGR